MKKNKNSSSKNKKLNIFFKILSFLLILSCLVGTIFIIYFDILPALYLSLYIIGVGLIIFVLFKLLNQKRLKKWIKILLSIPSVLIIVGYVLVCLYSMGTINFLNDIVDVGLRTDTYSVYVRDDSKYLKVNDLKDKIIGISDINEESTKKAVDKLSNKIEYNTAEFNTTVEGMDAVENKEADAVLALDTNIDVIKSENIDYSNLVPIYTFTVTTKVDTKKSKVDVTKENFVIYLSGIDTNGKVADKARSDVNIIVAVNPKQNKILMVNTPRDYYVKLHSKKAMDKLTHAGIYGIEESMSTLEDLYNINIDYYARGNFTSFVNVVEKLGGITVDVPVNFCEQTSSRTSSKQICLKKGTQELNGEQALALARTRHTLSGGDRARIENQMLVLKSIFNKATSPSILVKYNSLLESLTDSVVTNIDQKTITKLIKTQLKEKTDWTIESYSTDGSDASSTTYSTGRSKAYVMMPKSETVAEAKDKLGIILETKTNNQTTTTVKQ